MNNPVPADEVCVGDLVTVQFRGDNGSSKPDSMITASGRVRLGPEGDLMLGLYIVAHANGNSGPDTICVIKRTPAEPPVGTMILDGDDGYWAHVPEGWVFLSLDRRDGAKTWERLAEDYPTFELVTA